MAYQPKVYRKQGGNTLVIDTALRDGINGVIELDGEYTGLVSYQPIALDMKLGGAIGAEGKKIGPAMFNVINRATPAAITTKPIIGAAIHAYSLTNAHSSTYPVGCSLAQISDGVDDDAVHGHVSYIDGDSSRTRAGAAFKVMHNNSVPGSGFKHGLDLSGVAHDGYNAVSYREADIKLASGGLIASFDTAITANVTTTTLAVGTLGKTTHATGRASLFVSDGAKWQFLTNS